MAAGSRLALELAAWPRWTGSQGVPVVVRWPQRVGPFQPLRPARQKEAAKAKVPGPTMTTAAGQPAPSPVAPQELLQVAPRELLPVAPQELLPVARLEAC